MNERDVIDLLVEVDALIEQDHFVYTSGGHGHIYINKDVLSSYPAEMSLIGREIARRFVGQDVEVIVAPAVGGIPLSQWVAYHLGIIEGRTVRATYAQREEKAVKFEKGFSYRIGSDKMWINADEEEVIVRSPRFVLRRGYDKIVSGRNVLVTEDIVNKGKTVKKVIEVTKTFCKKVVGAASIWNRGGIGAKELEVPLYKPLVNYKIEEQDENTCDLCKLGIAISTDVGKGQEFLDRKRRVPA